MRYDCDRCQDRGVVGGFLPAPCPECRAADAHPPTTDLCRDLVECRRQLALAESQRDKMEKKWATAVAFGLMIESERDSALARLAAVERVYRAAVEWSESFGELSKRLPPHVHKLRNAVDAALNTLDGKAGGE